MTRTSHKDLDNDATTSSTRPGPLPGEALSHDTAGQGNSSALAADPKPSSRLDVAIFAFLLLFAAALPLSKALTEVAYSAAMLLWVAKIVLRRERPRAQPLVGALLAFLLLSALSSLLSSAPAMSWDRMKSVGLLMIAVLFAQNVRSLRQVRALIIVLLFCAFLSTAFNAWLYTYGIGAKLVNPGPVMMKLGALPGDVIVSVNGRRTRTSKAALREINASDPTQPFHLLLFRGEIPERIQLQADRSLLAREELLRTSLTRGRPVRAKGSFSSPVTYGEMLQQEAMLAWGLLLAATLARKRWKWALLLLFVLICATLGATATRASLVACVVAGLITLWLCIERPLIRSLSLVLVIALLSGASLLVQHERGLGMVATNDAGTNYRVLMWEDGLRLARQHPWFGVGMDTIKVQWQQLNIRAYQRYALHSHFHSTPIQLAAERGLPALVAWITLLCLYIRVLWRLRRVSTKDWFQRGTVLGILAATIGFLTSSLVHYNLGDSEVQMLFWFLMGLALALHGIIQGQESQLEQLPA